MKVLNHWKLKYVVVTLAEGVPRAITVTSDEITQAISDPLQSIVSAVKSALEQTPPELSSDIAERGIVLTGGGALLRNLDKLLGTRNRLACGSCRRSI